MSKLYDLLSAMCGKIKKPDWNQNDPTAPDYVKNRPFYNGDPVETVLVEESTVPFTSSGGMSMAKFSSSFVATIGETYTVLWDGTAYESTCVEAYGSLFIGNLSIATPGSDTGEPFIMAINSGIGIMIYSKDTATSHTFSISGFVAEPVKIDSKYLPDSIKTIFYYSEQSKMVYKDPNFTEGLTKDEVLEAFVSTGITLYLECDGYADVLSLIKDIDADAGQHELHFYHPEKATMMRAKNAVT